jgi:hypothetical protein
VNFFRQMDLYKIVILISIVLLPVTGWWINHTMQEIAVAQRAVVDAAKPGGWLERIGKTRGDLEVISKNVGTTDEAAKAPQTYFETQIMRSAAGAFSTSDFKVLLDKEDHALAGGDRQKVTDYTARIEFLRKGNKGIDITREILFAVLFNCESGARGKDIPTQSIWKLQSLEVQNTTASAQDKFSNHKAPPSELEDRWSTIKPIIFVRREPQAKDIRK